MRTLVNIAATLIGLLPSLAFAGDEGLPGTYKLVSSTRTILETGEVRDSYGKQPTSCMARTDACSS
jgi:hypothetical protein